MEHKPKKNNSSKKELDREQKRISEMIQNRRPLHTISLEGPEYTIRPEILLKDGGYCEKEIRVGFCEPLMPILLLMFYTNVGLNCIFWRSFQVGA